MHGEFEVVRDLTAPVEAVWDAFRDPGLRHRWRRIPGADSRLALDFREGGEETLTGSFSPTGVVETIDSRTRFLDIAPLERIVSSQALTLDGVRRWVSLVALTFEPTVAGTRLRHHEQYAFLVWAGDGSDDRAHLRGSVSLSLNALQAVLDTRESR